MMIQIQTTMTRMTPPFLDRVSTALPRRAATHSSPPRRRPLRGTIDGKDRDQALTPLEPRASPSGIKKGDEV